MGARSSAAAMRAQDNERQLQKPTQSEAKMRLVLFAFAIWFCAGGACAADSSNIPRIGVLVPETLAPRWKAEFPAWLKEVGYVPGKTIVYEWLQFQGSEAEARTQADELVRSNCKLILALTTPAAKAAMAASDTVPVVFLSGDPVAMGLAQSLAHPGKNATGISVLSTELSAKRMDYLKQLVPRAKTIAYLRNPSNPIMKRVFVEVEIAAATLGVRLEVIDVNHASELEAALGTIRRKKVDAMLVSDDLMFFSEKAMSSISSSMRALKLPAMYPVSFYHDHGALISYSVVLQEVYRRVAAYVDRILKGAKPSELAVEQISKYELTIDLKVADALKIRVPQEILYRAEKVLQ